MIDPSRVEAVRARLVLAQQQGMLGPGDVAVHLEHAVGYLPFLPAAGAVLDLGSGGGVPGLVLAAWRPDLSFTLLDAMRRRTDLLERAVRGLGWRDQIRVVCGPAEHVARLPEHRHRYACVVSRSFGAPAVTFEAAVGFLATDGVLAVAEPEDVPVDVRWPAAAIRPLGFGAVERHGGFAVLRLDGDAPPQLPRRRLTPPLF